MNNEYGRKYGSGAKLAHYRKYRRLSFPSRRSRILEVRTNKQKPCCGCLGSGMTLALILFICLLGSAPMSAAVSSSTIQPAAQQESPPNPSDSLAPMTVKTSGPQGQNSSSP